MLSFSSSFIILHKVNVHFFITLKNTQEFLRLSLYLGIRLDLGVAYPDHSHKQIVYMNLWNKLVN